MKIWAISDKSYIFCIFIAVIINSYAKAENTYLKYSPKEDASFQAEKSVIGVDDNPSSIGLSFFQMKRKSKKTKCKCGNLKDYRAFQCHACSVKGCQSPSKKFYSGMRINNLVLIDYLGKRYWTIECDCGRIFAGRTDHIKRRKSCGCLSDASRFQRVSDKVFITNIKINHYKQSAKDRGFEWKLTNDEVYDLISGNCNYCGSPPLVLLKRYSHSIYTNGIDRVDSKIGYLSSNVVSCCKFCNFAKSNSALKEFNNWIKRLVTFQFKKNENLGIF